MFLVPCQEEGLVLDILFYSIGPCVWCFVCGCGVFDPMTLILLKLDIVIPTAWFFLIRTILINWSLLCVYINFRIFFNLFEEHHWGFE
jgi:hypothetical protein